MATTALWAQVVDHDDVVDFLRSAASDPVHAYLFLGPPGCTKWEAARAFAVLLIDPSGDVGARDARLALAGEHPDVREVCRVGPFITKDQADGIVHEAALTPVEGRRKVFILDEFHLVRPEAAATLLKTLEEPPASTVFVVLADDLPPELATIASRCVRVGFHPIAEPVLEDRLVAEGASHETARLAARHSGGNLDRARLLAADPGIAARRDAFAHVPRRLDGTGHVVCQVVDELLGLIESATEPLKQRQAGEQAELARQLEQMGDRSGQRRKSMDERHKRELRRLRVDELRAGLATIAEEYRQVLVSGQARDLPAIARGIDEVHGALEALTLNPNEALLLQSLMLRLPPR